MKSFEIFVNPEKFRCLENLKSSNKSLTEEQEPHTACYGHRGVVLQKQFTPLGQRFSLGIFQQLLLQQQKKFSAVFEISHLIDLIT